MTRTVRDTAAILDALEGPAVGDPHRAPRPERPFLEEVGRAPRKLSIAYTIKAFDGKSDRPRDSKGRSRYGQVARSSLGHEVREAAPDFSWEGFLHATACDLVLRHGLHMRCIGEHGSVDARARRT